MYGTTIYGKPDTKITLFYCDIYDYMAEIGKRAVLDIVGDYGSREMRGVFLLHIFAKKKSYTKKMSSKAREKNTHLKRVWSLKEIKTYLGAVIRSLKRILVRTIGL